MVTVVILSPNPPQRLIDDLWKQTYRDVEVLYAQEKGIVNAMNKALERARGEIFVRIDDDVQLPPNWLEELIAPFSDPTVAGVTGPTFVPKERRQNRDSIRFAENPKGLLKWLYDDNKFKPAGIRNCGCVSYDSNFEERFRGDSGYHDKKFPILPFSAVVLSECDHLEGTNWAMRTDLLRAQGGFDPKFDGVAEWFDTDVEAKIKKLGYRLIYNPKAYLFHMLEKGEHFNDRFQGFGRIKNFLRYHIRHSKFHPKMVVYLIVWSGYFLWRAIKK